MSSVPTLMAAASAGKSNLDQAVDILAAVLRVSGYHAFDLSDRTAQEISALYEQWAQHVLFATPPPGESLPPPGHGLRDWSGLYRFVIGHRSQEYREIQRALADTRDLIPQALESLQFVLSHQRSTEAQVLERLAYLRSAAHSRDLETLRREILQTVLAIGHLLAQQQQQQEQQILALQQQLTELREQLQQARAESARDPLTGLDNRKAFEAHLERTLRWSQASGHPACLVLIDADHFKRINDTYGHTVGDLTLITLANCLSRTFLRQDDCVARYGGEEFAVVLRDAVQKDVCRLLDRLFQAVRASRIPTNDGALQFTISAGLAQVRPGETVTQWIERADDALYCAKQSGRDRYACA
ncbi:MAG: GGDEF domain-containing protein [Chloroherpetonaceae bacterium]|nr:GGDEF domain-containing protein [Chthonomonadaceae bacterium]MDW8207653.1 GGDEF domain-containing protein [Chloroherpetonaceae bacterium]